MVIIYAPFKGEVVQLKDVPDQAFAEAMLGEGIALQSNDEITQVVSPVDGTITVAFPTNHAVGITTNDGIELLIHYGINTVELKGNGLKTFVKQGDVVKVGDPLIEANNKIISETNTPTVCPIIVTSGQKVKVLGKGVVNSKDKLFKVK